MIRNLALIAHGSTGKTTLAEALMFGAGASKRFGLVDNGTSMFDYLEDEIDRKFTITAKPAWLDYKNTKVNILDTPGFADFFGEVIASMSVADGAIVLVHGVSGVEVGTGKVWELAEKTAIPRFIFVNMMDKDNANFDAVLKSCSENLSDRIAPLFLPVGEGPEFKGVIDILKGKAYLTGENDGKMTETEIPAELVDRQTEMREKLVEAVAETDDALLEKYFEEGDLTREEIVQGLKIGTKNGTVYPLFCGSALNNAGVVQMLDYLVDLMPSIMDRGEIGCMDDITGEPASFRPDPDGPFLAQIFKSQSITHVGELSFFRVYSGRAVQGLDVRNIERNASSRIGQVVSMKGKTKIDVDELLPGDIGAAIKLKNCHTNEQIALPGSKIKLHPIDLPKPVISFSITPLSKGDEEKMSSGLSKLIEEDPTCIITYNSETKQTLIEGLGEVQIDILIQNLKKRFGIEVELGKPRIAYKETIRGKAEKQGKYKKQTGGRGQYGDCWLRLEPLEAGEKFEFVNAVVGGVIPSKFIPAVQKGVVETMDKGPVAGYPVTQVRVSVFDGSYHNVDSSENAFKVAASMGFKAAFMDARPVLLEPVYSAEIAIPEEFMGAITGDLATKRGRMQGMDPEGNKLTIKAHVPLAEMYKYSSALRSLTQGKGTFSLEFSHYEEVPPDVYKKIVEEANAE